MNKYGPLWEKVFQKKQFDLSQDVHFITANEIKSITHAEPRNMAKVDFYKDLPLVFKENGYFLLPVKNGKYAIVRGNGFHKLESRGAVKDYVSRLKFPLISSGRGSGEMQYLDYSFNSGALEKVVGVAPLYQSIRGREFSRAFKFHVNKTLLEVASVQIEVDSGLEGEDSIVLVEAKVNTPEDFIIRQLFYPYDHFKIIAPQKTIIPVFFTYEPKGKVYTFWIYEFSNPRNYNSIRLKEVKSLRITPRKTISLQDIRPKGVVVYKKLIPQANDLNKVIELVFKVSEGFDDYHKIADYFSFDARQSSYYREAAEALGLVSLKKRRYSLTEVGEELVLLAAEKRNLFVASLLSDFDLVKQSMDVLRKKGVLKQKDIERIISKNSKLSGSTIPRRAGSLSAWFRWIAESTGSIRSEGSLFRLE